MKTVKREPAWRPRSHCLSAPYPKPRWLVNSAKRLTEALTDLRLELKAEGIKRKLIPARLADAWFVLLVAGDHSLSRRGWLRNACGNAYERRLAATDGSDPGIQHQSWLDMAQEKRG